MKRLKRHKVLLPGYVRPERYQLTVRPDAASGRFSGEETIHLVLDRSVASLTLHAKDLRVRKVSFVDRAGKGSGAVFHAKNVSYLKDKDHVRLAFHKPLPKGRGELKLSFSGKFHHIRGFYRSSYRYQGKDRHLVTTQFEPTDARRAFPCFDEPHQKAVFDVTVVVPKHQTVISNTIEKRVTEHDSGVKVVEFEPTPKMSTYLVAYVAGDLEFIEAKSKRGVAVRVFTTPGKREQGRFALGVATRCLDLYERYFGVRYPLPILDLVAVPDFESAAMENWGLVTYRESALLVDESTSGLAHKQWVAIVTCHELAHQWFGNLVTMRWWTDLWLNEGFASYMEHWATDRLFPEWKLWEQFLSGRFNTALDLDMLKGTHPVEVEVGHPREIDEIFDQVSYAKGASVVRMLATYLGEATFKKGLRRYLSRHAFGNTDTEDLWRAFEHVSKKPVRTMMAGWTRQAGYPVVSVRDEGGRIRLTQSRFHLTPRTTNERWLVPVTVRFGPGKKTSARLISGSSITVKKPAGARWYKANLGETGFFRTTYDGQNTERLTAAAAAGKLSPRDTLGFVRDLFVFAETGQTETEPALELSANLSAERGLALWQAIVPNCLRLLRLHHGRPAHEPLAAFVQRLVAPQLKRLGSEPKKGEAPTDGSLRTLLLSAALQAGEPSVERALVEKFKRMRRGLPVHPDFRSLAYRAYARTGGRAAFRWLTLRYRHEVRPEERERLGSALGQLQDARLLKQVLGFAFSRYVKTQDSWIISLSVWANPIAADLAWEFVERNWKEVYGRYRATAHTFGRLLGGIRYLRSEAVANRAARFIAQKRLLGISRAVSQALEDGRSGRRWALRDERRWAARPPFAKKPASRV